MTVQRLKEFGETIFATMTALAVENDAVNLGQGFPDSDGPQRMLDIAQENIASGNNQYAPLRGVPELVSAIAETYSVPQDHVVITAGATEALAAAVLALVGPGDEVVFPWRSFEAVEYATLEWVDWFNNRRLLEPIGNIPPAEAEANFYAALETEPMAA